MVDIKVKGDKGSPRCDLCNNIITKYKMDLGSADCISFLVDSKWLIKRTQELLNKKLEEYN